MSPGWTAPLLTTSSVLTLPLIILLSISATFVALDLISNLFAGLFSSVSRRDPTGSASPGFGGCGRGLCLPWRGVL